RKSRTGGIVGRLISRTGLDLVGGRMFAPGAALAKRYAETIVTETHAGHRATQELIREYILKNFTGEKNGQRPRVLFLIFRGPDAVEKIHRTVGHILHERTSGETIRDTYGDYITDDSGASKTGRASSNIWLAVSRANVLRKNATRLERKNRSRSFTKASMQCIKSGTSSARLIRQKRRPARSDENSAKAS